jgi:hypothetical protein
VCVPGKQASSCLHHQLGFGISFIGSVVLKQKRSISGAFFGGWKKSSRDRFFWLLFKKKLVLDNCVGFHSWRIGFLKNHW